MNCSTKYQDIYRSCEIDTLMSFFSKSSESSSAQTLCQSVHLHLYNASQGLVQCVVCVLVQYVLVWCVCLCSVCATMLNPPMMSKDCVVFPHPTNTIMRACLQTLPALQALVMGLGVQVLGPAL